MDRLTARNKDGIAYLVKVKSSEQTIEGDKNTLECIYESMQRLAYYEDLEGKSKHSKMDKNKILKLLQYISDTVEELRDCGWILDNQAKGLKEYVNLIELEVQNEK